MSKHTHTHTHTYTTYTHTHTQHNAKYVLSVARKMGCAIFLLWEDVVEVFFPPSKEDGLRPLSLSFFPSDFFF
jgi:hypothetical protein